MREIDNEETEEDLKGSNYPVKKLQECSEGKDLILQFLLKQVMNINRSTSYKFL